MMMKVLNLLLLVAIGCEAFTPVMVSHRSASSLSMSAASNNQRRAFLKKAAVVGVAAVLPQVVNAESLDEIAERSRIANEKAALAKAKRSEQAASEKESGKFLVGAALAGGVVLTLPLFGPQLARKAGYKQAKTPVVPKKK